MNLIKDKIKNVSVCMCVCSYTCVLVCIHVYRKKQKKSETCTSIEEHTNIDKLTAEEN